MFRGMVRGEGGPTILMAAAPRTRSTKTAAQEAQKAQEAPAPMAELTGDFVTESLDRLDAFAAGVPVGSYYFEPDISVGMQVELCKMGWKYDVGYRSFTPPPDDVPNYLGFLAILDTIAMYLNQNSPVTDEMRAEAWAKATETTGVETSAGAVEVVNYGPYDLGPPEANAVYNVLGELKPLPEGDLWKDAAELFGWGGTLPTQAAEADFQKDHRLFGKEWREIRDFFLHPRDTGAPVHRQRSIPESRFYTRETPEGPVPTGGLSLGDGFSINWQDGVEGVTGAIIEDIIEYALIPRLQFFQDSRFSCMENGQAITHLRRAVEALNLRTQRRKTAGTEGTYRGQ